MKIILSNTSRIPIYEQIYNQIRNQILSSYLPAEEKLPSIRQLGKALGVSVITIKHAYELLESNDYIHTIGGKGSFVAGQSVERIKEKQFQLLENELYKTLNEMKKLGITKEDVEATLALLWEEE